MSQRNRLLVDPTVQWSIARRILLHWGLLLWCLLAMSTFVQLMFSAGSVPFNAAISGALKSQGPLLCVMLMLLPVFIRDTLKLSNRFAGPMYRLKTELASMSKGNPGKPIKFRTGDFWLEAAADFNQVLANIESLRQENEQLKSELARSSDDTKETAELV